MTLYYSLVFMILVAEMVSFLLLIAPLPSRMRRGVVNFISRSKLIPQVKLMLQFIFGFILVLFVDSLMRVYRVQEVSERNTGYPVDRSQILANKFYAQRNMYLCGFTLFLSMILMQNFGLVKKILENKHAGAAAAATDKIGETIESLKKELQVKERDIAALQNQYESLQREYYRLADENKKGNISLSEKKKQ